MWLASTFIHINLIVKYKMERFTPLYAIAYDITNSMENLRFDKEGYFHVLVFIKEIENICPVFPYVIETLVEVWEDSKLRGNTRSCSHFNFSLSQTSTRVSITVWKHGKRFLFLKLYIGNKHINTVPAR